MPSDLKEVFELADYIRHVGLDRFQRLVNPASIWERYVEVEAEVHLHFRRRSDGRASDTKPEDFCARLQRDPDVDLEAVDFPADLSDDLGWNVGHRRHNGHDDLVLVRVRERVENGQGVRTRLLPSLVRLESLDDCLMVGMNLAQSLLYPLSLPVGGSAADREAGASRGFLLRAVVKGELPSQVIERRPETMRNVPDEDSPSRPRFGGLDTAGDYPRFPLTDLEMYLGLKGDRVIGVSGVGFDFESLNVLTCPLDLLEAPVKDVSHGEENGATMPKKPQPLTRKGEKKQTTKEGLEIPVPKRREFFDALGKGLRKKPREEPPESGKP
jgi:hypothetical protein